MTSLFLLEATTPLDKSLKSQLFRPMKFPVTKIYNNRDSPKCVAYGMYAEIPSFGSLIFPLVSDLSSHRCGVIL